MQRRLGDSTDSGQQSRITRELLHSADRDTTGMESLCYTFSEFFIDKIRTLKDPHKILPFFCPTDTPALPFAGIPLDIFHVVISPAVLNLITKSSSQPSPVDFLPTSLLKSRSSVFSEIISNLANISISEGKFPSRFRLAQITPLLKRILALTKTLHAIFVQYPTSITFQICLNASCLHEFTPHHILLQLQPFPVCLPALLLRRVSNVTSPRQYRSCY